MFTIETKLPSCVADITREIERKFARQYIGREFTNDHLSIKVYLSEDTFADYNLRLSFWVNQETQDPTLSFALCKRGLDCISFAFSGQFTITQAMTLLDAMKCAGHVCGDYIKFSQQPISEL